MPCHAPRLRIGGCRVVGGHPVFRTADGGFFIEAGGFFLPADSVENRGGVRKRPLHTGGFHREPGAGEALFVNAHREQYPGAAQQAAIMTGIVLKRAVHD